MVLTLLAGLAVAADPVLVEARWVRAPVRSEGEERVVVDAPGDVPWRVRCREGTPARTRVEDGLRIEDTGAGPVGREGRSWNFAPVPYGGRDDVWEVRGVGCRVWVRDTSATSRGFDRLEATADADGRVTRAAAVVPESHARWLAPGTSGALDRYRVVRPPALWGPGLATLRPDVPEARLGGGWFVGSSWTLPAGERVHVQVRAPDREALCLALDGQPSCRRLDRGGEASWWVVSGEGGTVLTAPEPVEARLTSSVVRAPTGTLLFPDCPSPDGCISPWSRVAPLGRPPEVAFLTRDAAAATPWVPLGHEALAEGGWVDEAGRARLLVIDPGSRCALVSGPDRYRSWVPDGQAALETRLVVGSGAAAPRVEGCAGWLRVERDAPVPADARWTLRRAARVEPGLPVRWAVASDRRAAVWIGRQEPGGVTVALPGRTLTLTIGPDAPSSSDASGDAWRGPIRVPLGAGWSGIEVASEGPAVAWVVQEDLEAPVGAGAVSLPSDLRTVQTLSGRLGAAEDPAERGRLLRARAVLAASLGLDSHARDDLRRADGLDPGGTPEGALDPWPAFVRLLVGEDRLMPVDASWVAVDAPGRPPRADDPLLALRTVEPEGTERLRLWRRAIVDGQVLTGRERVQAYVDLVRHGTPELRSSGASLVIRMLSRWERVHGVRGATSALRPRAVDPEAREEARVEDAFFPERWEPERTAALGTGGVLRWPGGEEAALRARCRLHREEGRCRVVVRDASTARILDTVELDGWGRSAEVALPASSVARTLGFEPSGGRTAQVLLPRAPELEPHRAWRAAPGEPLRVEVVGPTVLRILDEHGAHAAVTVREDDRLLEGSGGEWVVPGAGPVSLVVEATREAWITLDLRVPRDLPVAIDGVAPAPEPVPDAAPAPLAWQRARPPATPLTVVLGGRAGSEEQPDEPLLPALTLASHFDVHSRPGGAPLWLLAGAEQQRSATTRAAAASGALTWMPYRGRDRLALELQGRLARGGPEGVDMGSARLALALAGGRWLSPAWLLEGRLEGLIRERWGAGDPGDLPLLWSAYAEDHRRSLRGTVGGRFAPVGAVDLRGETWAASNERVGDGLDRIGAGVSADLAIRSVWVRVGGTAGRWLADADRPAGYTQGTLYARGWVFGWVRGVLGVQWRLDAALRVGGSGGWAIGTGPVLWISRDRGLRDVAPQVLAHREAALWGWDQSAHRAFVGEPP